MTVARALAAVVLVALLAGCGGSANPTGKSEFGAAPGGSAPATSPGTTDAVPAFTFSPSPGPSAANGSADLRASYQVKKGLFGAKSTVVIKLTNTGTAPAQGWTLIMGMSGVTLSVKTSDEVKHEVRDGQHVFTPNGLGSTVNPGDLINFSFDVTGLGSVTSCTVNGRDCTAA